MSTGAHRGQTTNPIQSSILRARLQRERLNARRGRQGLPAIPPLDVGALSAPPVTYNALAKRHLALIMAVGVLAFVATVLVATWVNQQAPGYAHWLHP